MSHSCESVSLISKQIMAAQHRPNPRRGPPSGGNNTSKWPFQHRAERLKTPVVDDLDQYGLPSKGETRLNDHKRQEEYYNKIVERYMRFCGDSGGGEDLTKLFATLSLSPATATSPPTNFSRPISSHSTLTISSSSRVDVPAKRDPSVELSLILSAMRKLREAVVASNRLDIFAQRAYIFIIHAAILVRHYESYHPALLHLINFIHPKTPLSDHEYHEFMGYHILDTACRLNDLTGAYALKVTHGYQDRRIEGVLRALANDNWVKFWKLRRAVDGYQARLLESAEEAMRLHVLKSLGRSYMNVDKSFVERSTEATWDELVAKGVGWQLVEETNLVLIRKPKAK